MSDDLECLFDVLDYATGRRRRSFHDMKAVKAALEARRRDGPEAEERRCTCGAGHGSLEGHMDWCAWLAPDSTEDRSDG